MTNYEKSLIVVGSKSDSDVANKAADLFDHFGIPYDIELASADRTPEKVDELAKSLENGDYLLCIAIAGMSAVLPAAIKAKAPSKPVLGVPVAKEGASLAGADALYSIVQRPPGSPVATFSINGGENAALFAVEIYAMKHPELRNMLKKYKLEQTGKKGYFERYQLR